nr:hypothetical protein [Deltaproteobacteria bacterium]
LRELAVHARIGELSTSMLAERFGPQLELLDLRGNHHALRYLNDLKRKVVGELLVGEPRTVGLLRACPAIQMPWWDHVALE